MGGPLWQVGGQRSKGPTRAVDPSSITAAVFRAHRPLAASPTIQSAQFRTACNTQTQLTYWNQMHSVPPETQVYKIKYHMAAL